MVRKTRSAGPPSHLPASNAPQQPVKRAEPPSEPASTAAARTGSRAPRGSIGPASPAPRDAGAAAGVGAAGGPGSVKVLKVAFLGLGNMGLPMATNLVQRGFSVRVWNRTPARAAPLVKAGAALHPTPRACVSGADVVITMLSDRAALAAVFGGAEGILAGLGKRVIVVEMSTVGRAAVYETARLVEAVGGRFIDSPVSGSVVPAEKAQLVALVGGKVKDLARVEPVLRAMCNKIVHAGDVGQGQALKVVLNGLGAHHLVAFASMLVLGERAGLARTTLLEAFTTGAFASPSYVGKKEKVLARDYSPEFSLSLALKDCLVNVELQREVGLPLLVHRECMREIEEGVREGLGAEDLFALEKHFVAR